MPDCVDCEETLPKSAFSKAQFKKPASERRCKKCASNVERDNGAVASPPLRERKSLDTAPESAPTITTLVMEETKPTEGGIVPEQPAAQSNDQGGSTSENETQEKTESLTQPGNFEPHTQEVVKEDSAEDMGKKPGPEEPSQDMGTTGSSVAVPTEQAETAAPVELPTAELGEEAEAVPASEKSQEAQALVEIENASEDPVLTEIENTVFEKDSEAPNNEETPAIEEDENDAEAKREAQVAPAIEAEKSAEASAGEKDESDAPMETLVQEASGGEDAKDVAESLRGNQEVEEQDNETTAVQQEVGAPAENEDAPSVDEGASASEAVVDTPEESTFEEVEEEDEAPLESEKIEEQGTETTAVQQEAAAPPAENEDARAEDEGAGAAEALVDTPEEATVEEVKEEAEASLDSDEVEEKEPVVNETEVTEEAVDSQKIGEIAVEEASENAAPAESGMSASQERKEEDTTTAESNQVEGNTAEDKKRAMEEEAEPPKSGEVPEKKEESKPKSNPLSMFGNLFGSSKPAAPSAQDLDAEKKRQTALLMEKLKEVDASLVEDVEKQQEAQAALVEKALSESIAKIDVVVKSDEKESESEAAAAPGTEGSIPGLADAPDESVIAEQTEATAPQSPEEDATPEASPATEEAMQEAIEEKMDTSDEPGKAPAGEIPVEVITAPAIKEDEEPEGVEEEAPTASENEIPQEGETTTSQEVAPIGETKTSPQAAAQDKSEPAVRAPSVWNQITGFLSSPQQKQADLDAEKRRQSQILHEKLQELQLADLESDLDQHQQAQERLIEDVRQASQSKLEVAAAGVEVISKDEAKEPEEAVVEEKAVLAKEKPQKSVFGAVGGWLTGSSHHKKVELAEEEPTKEEERPPIEETKEATSKEQKEESRRSSSNILEAVGGWFSGSSHHRTSEQTKEEKENEDETKEAKTSSELPEAQEREANDLSQLPASARLRQKMQQLDSSSSEKSRRAQGKDQNVMITTTTRTSSTSPGLQTSAVLRERLQGMEMRKKEAEIRAIEAKIQAARKVPDASRTTTMMTTNKRESRAARRARIKQKMESLSSLVEEARSLQTSSSHSSTFDQRRHNIIPSQ